MEPRHQLEFTTSPFETLDMLLNGDSENCSEMVIHTCISLLDDFSYQCQAVDTI